MKIKKVVNGKIVHTGDDPLKWFPELETLFEHFHIRRLVMDVDGGLHADRAAAKFIIEKEKS